MSGKYTYIPWDSERSAQKKAKIEWRQNHNDAICIISDLIQSKCTLQTLLWYKNTNATDISDDDSFLLVLLLLRKKNANAYVWVCLLITTMCQSICISTVHKLRASMLTRIIISRKLIFFPATRCSKWDSISELLMKSTYKNTNEVHTRARHWVMSSGQNENCRETQKKKHIEMPRPCIYNTKRNEKKINIQKQWWN